MGFCALLFARALSIGHDATGLNLLLGSDEGFSCIDRRSSAPEAVQAFANQSLSLQELMDPRVPSDTSPTRLGPSVAFTYTLANHGPSPLVGGKVRARVGISQGQLTPTSKDIAQVPRALRARGVPADAFSPDP